ncbi:Chemotaxis protein CheY [Crateriforma conspicua]|uniref:Chemotaxis protein CheY n=2 Tax=Crateriforma TaxID=2714592 RepID=A0A5C6FN33_9PLAN|nr:MULTISPECIES: response regulator [Crateriforma]TWU62038.1 Chemotaxis protein CheY [Crateriforma conspicua]
MIRTLVVDDSKFMARAMKTSLEEMGFEVVGVGHDGFEGLDQFKQQRPDVTLLDVTMPNMDGVECLQKILEIDAEARVVMLSAIRDAAVIEQCMYAGAFEFLQKPIRPNSPADLSRLCSTLEKAVEKAC